MPRHPTTEGFLEDFTAYLQTLAGGKKTEALAREAAVDVAKFLYLANPQQVEPGRLLQRSSLTQFVATLEEMGVGSSGIRTKLVRLRLAIQYYVLTCEGGEDEERVTRRAELAVQLLQNVRGCVAVEKGKEYRKRLDSFCPPSLEGVGDFLTCSWLSAKISLLSGRLRSGGEATASELEEAGLIIVGRVMYRYMYVVTLGGF